MFDHTRFRKYLIVILFPLLLLACDSDEVQVDNEINDFVWRAMNSWYFFQADVDNLADSQVNDPDSYNAYLNQFDNPFELFNSLVVDDFSYMTDDLDELGGGFSAVVNSFGYDFILFQVNETDFVGQIRHVFEGSQAEASGLERGDFFVAVDGQTITNNNVDNLLFNDDNYTLSLATIGRDEDNDYVITPTGEELTVTETSFPRTAIWVNEVVEIGTERVGYISYSNFESTLHSELNQAFAEFRAAGITELVLDLRYNPGGSVLTATLLNSMIYRPDPDLFMGSLDFNEKHPEAESDLFFADTVPLVDENFERIGEEPLNSVNLDRVFILTSSSTASSSEFVINALEPFMDVVLIGDVTVGKNLGSISLFDNPPNYTEREGANPEHTFGLQPIVTTVSNSVGFFDYSDGFTPDVELREIDFLDEIRPLGDPAEQLFAQALSMICPTCSFAPQEYERMSNVKPAFELLQANPNYQLLDLTGMDNFNLE